MTTTEIRFNELVAAGIPMMEARYEAQFPADFAFEITANPEPDEPANMYFVRMYDPATLTTLDNYTTDRPYDDVEAAREVQAFPDFEERMDYYESRGIGR
jgi:hypothetical protein